MAVNKYRWTIVWVFFGVFLITYMDRVNLAICAVTVMKEFGMSKTQLGLIFSAFTVGYTIMNFPAGFLIQKFTYRVVLAVCLILWSLATFATGMAHGFISLLIIRIVFGMMEGPVPPGLPHTVNKWMLPREKGFAVAMYCVAVPVGVVVGNALSGWILESMGWRPVFYIFGVLGLVIAAVCWWIVRDTPREHKSVSKEELELIESYYVKHQEAGKGSTFGQILKDPWVWVMSLAWFTFAIAFWATLNWFPAYLVLARGTSILKSGYLSSAPWAVGIIGFLVLGKLSDKLGHGEKSNILGFGQIIAAPCIVFGVMTPDLTTCIVFFSIALFFIIPFIALFSAMPVNMYPQEDVAKVVGMTVAFSSAGGIIAPSLMGYIVDVTKSFEIAYYVCAASTLLSGILCLIVWKKEREELIKRKESGVGYQHKATETKA